MPSPAIEDYLKAIFNLETQQAVTTNNIAQTLNVTAASVTNMLKRLSDANYVDYSSYRGVKLTPLGRRYALRTIRKHRLMELFLFKLLDYTWDEVHDEAEELEHVISDRMEEAIYKMLGNPVYDPHGDPIPDRDGTLPEIDAIPLSEVKPRVKVIVRWVDHSDPEYLRYVEKLGLLPTTELEVINKEPFGGPFVLQVNKMRKTIGVEASKKIFVSVIE